MFRNISRQLHRYLILSLSFASILEQLLKTVLEEKAGLETQTKLPE